MRYRPASIEYLRMRQVTRKRGQLIISQGAQTGPIYTIRSGWAVRFRSLPQGRRQILSFLLPGDSIGVEYFGRETQDASIRALTDLSLCEFERQSFFVTLFGSTESSLSFAAQFLRRNSASDQAIVALGRFSAIERLANLIVSLRARLMAGSDELPSTFELPLRRDDFADALGLTPVHVSRTFARLREMAILDFRGGEVSILDEARLQALSTGGLVRAA